jgi:hypothetical protein
MMITFSPPCCGPRWHNHHASCAVVKSSSSQFRSACTLVKGAFPPPGENVPNKPVPNNGIGRLVKPRTPATKCRITVMLGTCESRNKRLEASSKEKTVRAAAVVGGRS